MHVASYLGGTPVSRLAIILDAFTMTTPGVEDCRREMVDGHGIAAWNAHGAPSQHETKQSK
jgi:hypothetical protein